MTARVTQQLVRVGYTTNPEARATRMAVEVIRSTADAGATTAKIAKLTSYAILKLDTATARVTQQLVLVAYTTNPEARATQMAIEVIMSTATVEPARIDKLTGYAVLENDPQPANIYKLTGYAVLGRDTAKLAKLTGYAVLRAHGADVEMAKLTGYAVIAPPPVPIYKLTGYAVLRDPGPVARMDKVTSYVVLARGAESGRQRAVSVN